MCRWGLMELKCVSLWAHICYMYYLKNTTKEERNYIIIYIYIYIYIKKWCWWRSKQSMVEYQTKKKVKKTGFFLMEEKTFLIFSSECYGWHWSWTNIILSKNTNKKKKLKEKQSKLTLKQILQSLLIAFGQVKTGTTSENVLNKIHEVIYSLYPAKEVNEKVYNKIMNLIQI